MYTIKPKPITKQSNVALPLVVFSSKSG